MFRNRTFYLVLSVVAVVLSLTPFWAIIPTVVVLNWGINKLLSYLRERELGDTSVKSLVIVIVQVLGVSFLWLAGGGLLTTLAVVAYLVYFSWKKRHKPGLFLAIGLLVATLFWAQAVVFFLALTALGHQTGVFEKAIGYIRYRRR